MTTETKQPTCEERISAKMEGALTDLKEAGIFLLYCEACNAEWRSEDETEQCFNCDSAEDPEIVEEQGEQTAYREGILEITKLHVKIRVGLSTGGPADGFYLYVDPETNEIEEAEYYFQDWFDGATRRLHGEDLDAVVAMFQEWVELC